MRELIVIIDPAPVLCGGAFISSPEETYCHVGTRNAMSTTVTKQRRRRRRTSDSPHHPCLITSADSHSLTTRTVAHSTLECADLHPPCNPLVLRSRGLALRFARRPRIPGDPLPLFDRGIAFAHRCKHPHFARLKLRKGARV
jgi:hypothetical protein